MTWFCAAPARSGAHGLLIGIALIKIQTNWKASSREKATDLENVPSEARLGKSRRRTVKGSVTHPGQKKGLQLPSTPLLCRLQVTG